MAEPISPTRAQNSTLTGLKAASRADAGTAWKPPLLTGPPLRELSPSAKSMFLFGWYVVFDGLFLICAPQVALRICGLAEEGTGWLRVLGMVVTFLGWYYVNLAKLGVTPFFRLTAVTRLSVPFVLGAFAIAGWIPAIVLAFGLGDFAGGLWTFLALRHEDKLTRDAA